MASNDKSNVSRTNPDPFATAWDLTMFRFTSAQRIFDVGGVEIGGQPGELPTVLIGSIFHAGHKIVTDPIQGIFNKKKAESLIRIQEKMSDKTRNPHMIDVVGESTEALKKYIDFISELTETPFLINGPTSSVRIQALNHTAEVGVLDRAVYTSINYTASEDEVTAIREAGLKSAIFQAFNPKNITAQGMPSILEGTNEKEGLLRIASRAGLQKILILAPVLDIPSIGSASAGIQMLKNNFGLPTGAAHLGVIGQWKRAGEFNANAKKICRGVAAALVQFAGADFLIYGSIGKANFFPACAMIDAIIAYNARSFGSKPLSKNHPLYKIL